MSMNEILKVLIITFSLTLSLGVNAMTDQEKQETINSLVPFQKKWVDSFNRGDYNACSNMYFEAASFIMYHGHGENNHLVANGREEITGFWKNAVENMKLANMHGSEPRYAVISNEKVSVSYETVIFGSQEDLQKESFKGIIHSEIWEKVGKEWLVSLDITEARN